MIPRRIAILAFSMLAMGGVAIYYAPEGWKWLRERQLDAEIAQAQAQAAESRSHFLAAFPNLRVASVRYVEFADTAAGVSATFHNLHVNSASRHLSTDASLELRASFDRMLSTEPNFATACFDPHHSISLSNGNETFDVIVCFNCGRFLVYSPEGRFWGQFTADERKTWDTLFAAAGLKMPESARDPELVRDRGAGV